MSDYQFELKQLVSYPRCRIYRQFIRSMMEERSLRTGGSSFLYFYLLLCSYANFRTSYRRVGSLSLLVQPGEWACEMTDICRWFRCRFQYQAMDILNCLQRQHFITFSRLARGKVIKYQIVDWKKTNRILEYNAPCQKDTGFFFISVAKAEELISLGRCAETDMFFDLWLHGVYNDAQVRGSAIGPVVYFRNGSGNPLTNYAELAARWGVSKSTVGRTLEKFVRLGYLTVVAGTGKTGSAIYLHAYLSTMFQISDIMLDKEEIAMALHMVIRADEIKTTEPDAAAVQVEIPDGPLCVPKPVISCLVRKFLQLLAGQGFPCLSCGQCRCRLSVLVLKRQSQSAVYHSRKRNRKRSANRQTWSGLVESKELSGAMLYAR